MLERSAQTLRMVWNDQENNSIAMKADLWRIQLQCAFNTSSHAGQNDPGISFEAFSPSINKRDDGAGIHNFIFIIQQGYLKITIGITAMHTLVRGQGTKNSIVVSHQHPIHPASGNDGVQSADNDVELWTKITQVSALRILLYELCQCIHHAAQTLTPVERLIQVLDLFKVAACFVLGSFKQSTCLTKCEQRFFNF